MWAALAPLLAKLAVEVMREFLARKDISDKAKLEIAHEAAELARVALEWKARAAARPDGGAILGVRRDDGTLRLSADATDPDRGTPGAPVSDRQ